MCLNKLLVSQENLVSPGQSTVIIYSLWTKFTLFFICTHVVLLNGMKSSYIYKHELRETNRWSACWGLPLCLSWYRIHLQCGRPGFYPWVGKIPWRRERVPTPVFWPGEFHGLYSPWGRKESDTTEWLSLTYRMKGQKKRQKLEGKTKVNAEINR